MSVDEMLEAPRAAGFAWEHAHEVTLTECCKRNEVELGHALDCHGGENIANTGASAVCLQRHVRTARIRATGFSLAAGYSYTEGMFQRAHIPVDSESFARPIWQKVIGDG